MRIVYFCHSVVSDWNHGNAHFLRGLMRALVRRGHDVVGCERRTNWSSGNLLRERGAEPILDFRRHYPELRVSFYDGGDAVMDEVDELTRSADLAIVHEFNDPELIGALNHVRRRRRDFVLLFHDTHHRAFTAPHEIARYNLEHYDGILAYGASLAELYRAGFGRDHVWVFHEAADTSLFQPLERDKTQDVVWIGNWGDDERSDELRRYLIGAAAHLPELGFVAYGVRYPDDARRAVSDAGIEFRGWLPNYDVPEVYARSRLTLHIPRGPYVGRLPGIPTIRPFEALACGIPLLSTPWDDSEGLFRTDHDFLIVRSPVAMREQIARLAADEEARQRLTEHGLETIMSRHTCGHRAEQLEAIFEEVAAVL